MRIINFIFINWDSALIILLFISVIIFLIKKGETKIINKLLFRLVTEAERQFGSGTGELKFNAVTDWIYERLPLIIRLLFALDDIENLIETALFAAKQKWERNPELKAYVTGEVKTSDF